MLNFDRKFVLSHARSIIDFYTPRICDPAGGYQQNYFRDGSVFDSHIKQLVSSTRMVVNFSNAYALYKEPEYREIALHGLSYIEKAHWQEDTHRYAWLLHDSKPQDMTQQAYGYAFILLTYAVALRSGVISKSDRIEKTWQLLEERFWLDSHQLYADEISENGELSSYRGQNANMHLCEALLAAYEATNENRYLQRAATIAQRIAVELTEATNGLIWEHYQTDFTPDWEYNKNDPKNLYRPWGFQPGHHTEWAKLLLLLNHFQAEQRWVDRAAALFDWAFDKAWDQEHDGLFYGIDPDDNVCDNDKYFWVQAESIAAAALLYKETGLPKYQHAYQQLWEYSWEHFIDHKFGAWHRLLSHNNNRVDEHKSLAGAKCDYHTFGMCYDLLRVLK